MTEHDTSTQSRRYSRRRFLGQVGAVGAVGLAAPLIGAAASGAETPKAKGPTLLGRAPRTSSIKQIIVACQENHSFDHYLGSYSQLPSGYGIPSTFSNSGIKPWHFTDLTDDDNDLNHDWTSTHDAYADGNMTGFVSNGNGRDAMGYYTSKDLPYYYSLLPEYTLLAEYFCGMLTDTSPNRMVLYAGTSGGYTDNSAPVNGSMRWPNITTLLAEHKITYKNYNFHCSNDSSILAMWSNNYKRSNMNQSSAHFMSDCKAGTLPQVSFITDAPPYDEHPPARIRIGETMIEGIVKALQASPQWETTALFVTYDEAGGYFDHRRPIELDDWGSGIRVPGIMISPLAKKGHIDTTYSDHGSVLKFIEHVFGLPTLASINTEFNTSTPNVGEGGGRPFPPRDGYSEISNLTQCFSVSV